MDPTPERIEHLITQLKWRLGEGMGEAIYEVGVEDNGGIFSFSFTSHSTLPAHVTFFYIIFFILFVCCSKRLNKYMGET